jgi:hypothetical protein
MQFGQKGRRDKKNVTRRDPEKEAIIGALSVTLSQAGFVVRREELKRGLGWRAMSGVCRVMNQNVVFVDKRLSHDEQISFLQGQIALLLGDANEPSVEQPGTSGVSDESERSNGEEPINSLPPV